MILPWSGVPTIKKAAVKPAGKAQIKWLPITEKASVQELQCVLTGIGIF